MTPSSAMNNISNSARVDAKFSADVCLRRSIRDQFSNFENFAFGKFGTSAAFTTIRCAIQYLVRSVFLACTPRKMVGVHTTSVVANHWLVQRMGVRKWRWSNGKDQHHSMRIVRLSPVADLPIPTVRVVIMRPDDAFGFFCSDKRLEKIQTLSVSRSLANQRVAVSLESVRVHATKSMCVVFSLTSLDRTSSERLHLRHGSFLQNGSSLGNADSQSAPPVIVTQKVRYA